MSNQTEIDSRQPGLTTRHWLRGRFAPPDPAARSQEPAAIRAREHSEARPQTVTGHRGTT
jgi:hypothetical protein